MNEKFPKGFLLGTATSACQTETTRNTNWYGLRTRDGITVDRNIEHDLHRLEDTEIIALLGNAYRFNPDWAKLQNKPFGQLGTTQVENYRSFMGALKDKGLHLMFVLHHFANPNWFEKVGGWESNESPDIFADYSEKMAREFGDLTSSWNTINEPMTHAVNGYFFGFFPPCRKNPIAAIRVLKSQRKAHRLAYDSIKERLPNQMVGVSNATMDFRSESCLGQISAGIARKIYLEIIPDMFLPADFIGISYYGCVPFNPLPVTEIENPRKLDKMGRAHDKMWEYYPCGLEKVINHFHGRYNKPIIITENGCCTDDDEFRIRSIKEHLDAVRSSIKRGADVRGYFHWSTFDNVELHLGPSWRFGLVHINYETMKRTIKPSGIYYSKLVKSLRGN